MALEVDVGLRLLLLLLLSGDDVVGSVGGGL